MDTKMRKNKLALAVSLLVLPIASHALSIKSIDVQQIDGDKTRVRFEMDEASVMPKHFQTMNPPRIALDFMSAKNESGKKAIEVNKLGINNLSIAETKDRVRVVANLDASLVYETKVNGNAVDLIVTKTAAKIPVTDKPINYNDMPAHQVQHEHMKGLDQQIKEVEFRRTKTGVGSIVLKLQNENSIVDIKEEGTHVIFNVAGADVSQQKRYDVIDFATPVDHFDVSKTATGAKIDVSTLGNYKFASFQNGKELHIEFSETKAEEAEKKKEDVYVGDKLSLNFQDIEIRAVLQILGDFTGLNIVAADSVTGNVTLRLNEVPWDQALDFVLKSKGLAKRQKGSVMLIAPTEEITKMEKDEAESRKVVEQLAPLVTQYIQINYTTASNVKMLLMGGGSSLMSMNNNSGCSSPKMTSSSGAAGSSAGGMGAMAGMNAASGGAGAAGQNQMSFISQRGSVLVDNRTNMLIVRETSENMDEIRKLVKLIDKPVRQVLVESRIVIASTDFAQQMGVKFGAAGAGSVNGNSYNVGGTIPPASASSSGSSSSSGLGPSSSNVLYDLGAAAAAGSGAGLGITLAKGADYLLNLEMSALQDQGNGEVISNPRITTADRCPAKINQGVQIPYRTVSNAGTQTQLIDAALELQVTPQITPNGNVIMDLAIKKDSPSTSLSNDGNVGIDTRSLNTNVQVRDGETLMLGGVFEGNSSKTINKVPILADIPYIGNAFKRTVNSDSKKELLIFITPKIIDSQDELKIK